MLVFPTNHIHRTSESERWWTFNFYRGLKDKTSLNLPQPQSNLSFNPTYLISYSISKLLNMACLDYPARVSQKA